jgi:N-acetylmuramoyl-L-alanine amidase
MTGMMAWLSLVMLLQAERLLSPLPVVAIDPGHGGAQIGAIGPCGLTEKDLTLAISEELAAVLRQSGRATPLLTRPSDLTLGLPERAAIANAAGASLFLSIHGNASTRPTARGLEVYFLSLRAANRRAAWQAERENHGDKAPGATSDDALTEILWSLQAQANHAQSQRFALSLYAALSQGVGRAGHRRGVLQAPFLVLLSAQMPAALVEVGFLTNLEECQDLASTATQRRIAQSLAAAVLAELAAASASGATQPAVPLTVGEVDHGADHEPRDEAHPGFGG